VQYHPSDRECILLHSGYLKECDSLSNREKVAQGHNGYYEIRLNNKHFAMRNRN
jgi:hypothetical protein